MKPVVKQPPRPAQVRIERVGADGDGVGTLPDGVPVYVPFTLPNEVVTVGPTRPRGEGWLARADSIEQVSQARIEAPCDYFGRCGGCALQHWREPDYADWKTGLLVAALRRAGYAEIPAVTLLRGLPGERRRLDFAVRRSHGKIILGLHSAGSGEVIDLTHCLVLHPMLMALMTPLRTVLYGLAAIRRAASVVINLLDSGPDVLLRTDAALSLADRNALISFAQAHGVPRLSWASGNAPSEPVCMFRPPVAILSGVEVRPPPGVFLQATAAAEAAIVTAILAGLPERMTSRSRIAELYAGCGTLTFALAGQARVAAWEGDAASVSALKEAANRAGLAGRIDVTPRDLARQPLAVKELAGFAAVVLDPPHAGAAAQIVHVAAARVPAVIYVSCNPATLLRDARTLHAAGYTLSAVTAIDQFLWSARLETVSVFHRGA
ncbi:class I SAM-dependent RNA methyltransferase [Rhodopila sp.]|uniref:class I SAM-dependent RNA methyltransferase n=1 Tax=Rhodopila sp. TaxID=2480087 RepID=UPI003D0A6AF5